MSLDALLLPFQFGFMQNAFLICDDRFCANSPFILLSGAQGLGL